MSLSCKELFFKSMKDRWGLVKVVMVVVVLKGK